MKEMIPWEAGAVVEKAYQDDKGKMHVVAVASDDAADLQSDQMSKSALSKMADDANTGIPLLDNHKSTFEFGRSVSGAVVIKEVDGKPVQQFVVDLELDGDYPQARALYKEIKSKRCNKQLSIGGKLNLKNPNSISITMTEKGLVRQINDLELDHIACTRAKHAANPRTGFMAALMKSLDDDPEMTDVLKDREEEAKKNFVPKENDSSEALPTSDEIAKDVENGLGILSKIGRYLRKNGGQDMGLKNSVVSKMGEFDEESTSDDSSVSDDTAKQVDAMLASASPGLSGEDEEEKSWPMDDDSEDKSSDETSSDSSDDSDDSSDDSDDSDDSSDDSDDSSDDSDDSDDSSEDSTDESSSLEELKADDEADFAAAEFDEETTTPEEEEAAKILLSRRLRRNEVRKQQKEENEEDMVREIAILLSKAKRLDAGNRVEREAMRGALWNVRFLLAKHIMEKGTDGAEAGAEAGAAEAMATMITESGPYAPTTESAAKGKKVAGDKQQGETDMARSSVTDARKQPAYGEAEGKGAAAPTAQQSAGMMAAAASMAAKLPQMNESAEYGKSLEKSLSTVVEKTTQAASTMVLKATERIVAVQKEQIEMLSKRLESLE